VAHAPLGIYITCAIIRARVATICLFILLFHLLTNSILSHSHPTGWHI
jgi:hypothetical protein